MIGPKGGTKLLLCVSVQDGGDRWFEESAGLLGKSLKKLSNVVAK